MAFAGVIYSTDITNRIPCYVQVIVDYLLL
jgi:hypothetical protein